MISWHDEYSKTLEQASNQSIKNRNAIIGFNVNIDKIIEITPESIDWKLPDGFDLKLKNSLLRLPSRVNSIEDFFLYLMDSMMNGKAVEVGVTSEEIADWIENSFEIENVQIGGQAGIIANLFKSIEVGNVLLSLPTYDAQFAKLLNPTLLTVVEEGNSHSICEINKLKFTDNEPISHYIFEFKAGNYELNSLKFVCPRDNRFIFSYDTVNGLLKFNKGFHEFSPNYVIEYSLAIISGFCLANEQLNSFEEIFDPIIEMIKEWKRINPNLFIHMELASTYNAKKRSYIKKNLFSLVDSIGVNEQELFLFSSIEEEQKVIKSDHKYTSTTLFHYLYELFLEYPHLRIHLHYLGYFLVMSPVMNNKKAESTKEALIMSSYFAASKAKKGAIKSFNDIYDVELDLSSKGFDELRNLHSYLKSQFKVKGNLYETGILETPSFSLVGVPTILVKNPQKLVGLGDTISSIAVLFDTND